MAWTENEIKTVLKKQQDFFRTGQTLDVNWRIAQLKRLKGVVLAYQDEIEEALAQDLGRSKEEAYFCDIGTVIMEINETLAGIRKWAKPELHFSGLVCFPSVLTKVYKMPYGTSLIISPFNFPILLSLGVLAASIAGGNTAMIKASSKSPACTALLQKMIAFHILEI